MTPRIRLFFAPDGGSTSTLPAPSSVILQWPSSLFGAITIPTNPPVSVHVGADTTDEAQFLARVWDSTNGHLFAAVRGPREGGLRTFLDALAGKLAPVQDVAMTMDFSPLGDRFKVSDGVDPEPGDPNPRHINPLLGWTPVGSRFPIAARVRNDAGVPMTGVALRFSSPPGATGGPLLDFVVPAGFTVTSFNGTALSAGGLTPEMRVLPPAGASLTVGEDDVFAVCVEAVGRQVGLAKVRFEVESGLGTSAPTDSAPIVIDNA